MTSLNKQQHLASLPTCGISLVIAGAGTGKTKTIIEKVKNIINDGVAKPEDILILTFSNKAAREIEDRVKYGIGQNTHSINSGTFHSFCLSLLRNNPEAFLNSSGFKRFPDVIDQEEKNKLQMNLLQDSIDRFLGIPLDVVSGLLENRRLDKLTQKKLTGLGIIKELEEFEQRFRSYKISSNLIDFGDMMRFSIDMLSNDNSIREQTINKYKYMLIDEFQDTSEENFKLINLILDKQNPNLFLVISSLHSVQTPISIH
jgi:DNA helicase-2/ATP-dependent DNA helicase PcrA